jgi:predicted nucleic acid-binding protein
MAAIQRDSHQHHVAVDALSTIILQGDRIFVTAQNLIEFWSVATRPSEANGLGWSVERAQMELDRMLDQFSLLEDVPAIIASWLALVTSHRVIGRRVHDARLVAAMMAHSVSHLLTFNVDDFRQFVEIVVVDPAQIVASRSSE